MILPVRGATTAASDITAMWSILHIKGKKISAAGNNDVTVEIEFFAFILISRNYLIILVVY